MSVDPIQERVDSFKRKLDMLMEHLNADQRIVLLVLIKSHVNDVLDELCED